MILLSLIKKLIPTQFLLLQAWLSYYYHTLIRDLFKKEIDNGSNKNYNNNKVANNNFSLEKLSQDNNIQFILFELLILLTNSWFLDGFLYTIITKATDFYITPLS